MNQRQLEAFHAVMTTGSTSQAARALHVTQPAVSALISNLEKTIGFELFERRREGKRGPAPLFRGLFSYFK
jgi:molybdate transport repressor ModE-like protein